MNGTESGHSGTANRVREGRQRGAADRESAALGWPRLLDVQRSFWMLRARMRKRQPVHDTVRRLLIDRADLDLFVGAGEGAPVSDQVMNPTPD